MIGGFVMQLSVYTDGGSRGNPGDAAIGGVALSPTKEVLHEFSRYLGVATNNEAEYQAVLHAITWVAGYVLGSKYDSVAFHLDSKLVVEQLNKKWKIKNDRMRMLADQCWRELENIHIETRFIHVRREHNSDADALVNQALDAHQL